MWSNKIKTILTAFCLMPVLSVPEMAADEAAAADTVLTPAGPGLVRAGSAFLRPLHKRDSVLIGDQMQYGFHLDSIAPGTGLVLPDVSGGQLADSVEVVSGWRLDTLKVRKKPAEMEIEGSLVITSFDEGVYELPDIRILRILADGRADTLQFAGRFLDVRTMPVDTATFEVHDIKGVYRYPLTFKEILPYVLGFQALALLIALAVSLVIIHRKKASGQAQSAEPPYITALKKLDRYRGNKYWAPEKQKQFYSGVTDILREYIAAYYRIGAMEMTTAEIFEALKGRDIDDRLMEEARNLFVVSDLVKFAKLTVSEEENVKAVPSAVRFVTSTWKSEESEAQDSGSKAETTSGKEGGNVL